MKVMCFHPGTQHSWQTATALQQLGLLEYYITSIFYRPDRWPFRVEGYLPAGLRQRAHAEFRRFEHPALDPALVKTLGKYEWVERVAARAGFRDLATKINDLGNRRFVKLIEHEIRSSRPFALWGYNATSLESFALAREMGRRCILDRTNGDFAVYNRLMAELQPRYAEYFIPSQLKSSEEGIAQDHAEYALADKIVVGSEFARSTLMESCPDEAIAAKTSVLNYCYDEALFGALPAPKSIPRNEPVRFLFLGQVIPRKGIHLLLEAIERLSPADARVTLVGLMGIPSQTFARFADRVDYIPTVARADVPQIMAAHHVFLLPTYFEGAGIVLYEALAAGMALIQTRNAALAATDDTGLYMETIDTERLLGAMTALIEDRDRLDHMRSCAQAEARNYTFAHYRAGIEAVLAEMGLVEA